MLLLVVMVSTHSWNQQLSDYGKEASDDVIPLRVLPRQSRPASSGQGKWGGAN